MSSNGNIFRVTGPLCGKSPVTGEFPSQRPVTRSFDVSFDLRLNKRLSRPSRRRWFETPSRSLWRHRNGLQAVGWCTIQNATRLYLLLYTGHTCYYGLKKCKEFDLSMSTTSLQGKVAISTNYIVYPKLKEQKLNRFAFSKVLKSTICCQFLPDAERCLFPMPQNARCWTLI